MEAIGGRGLRVGGGAEELDARGLAEPGSRGRGVGGAEELRSGCVAVPQGTRGLAEAAWGRGLRWLWAVLGGAWGLVRKGLCGLAERGWGRGPAGGSGTGPLVSAQNESRLAETAPGGRVPRVRALALLRGGALGLAGLARRRGAVLSARLGGREVLVLSAVGPIREALARNWGVWMGRPPSYLGSLVSQGGQDLALGAPCPAWRAQRAAARGALARAGPALRGLLERQGGLLIQELRSYGRAPLDPFEVFSFHTCSTIGRLLFGELLPPEPELRAFSRCVVELLDVWGRASVRALDLIPLLRVLPNPGLRELLHLVQCRDRFVEAQLQRSQDSAPPDSPLGVLLGRDPKVLGEPLSPPRLHMALVDLFVGGTETTAAALAWAVAFLLHRPELQVQLRAELWRELGPSGTPEPGDAARLPLLQATISETLRLRPPAPLALPHCALRDTSVAGVAVPAGSVLLPNLLAAQQDPEIWSCPRAFLPERFLSQGPPRGSLVPFGVGARSCVGAGLARAELFVFLGRILQEFRLEPPEPGVLPALGGTGGGTVLRCAPFRVRLMPWDPPELDLHPGITGSIPG